MRIFIAFVLFFTSTFVFSQEWELIGTGSNGAAYYCRTNTYDTAWIKIVSNELTYFEDGTGKQKTTAGHQLILFAFDCRDRQLGLVQTVTYDKEGKIVGSFSQKRIFAKMEYVLPDSQGEFYLSEICDRQ